MKDFLVGDYTKRSIKIATVANILPTSAIVGRFEDGIRICIAYVDTIISRYSYSIRTKKATITRNILPASTIVGRFRYSTRI